MLERVQETVESLILSTLYQMLTWTLLMTLGVFILCVVAVCFWLVCRRLWTRRDGPQPGAGQQFVWVTFVEQLFSSVVGLCCSFVGIQRREFDLVEYLERDSEF